MDRGTLRGYGIGLSAALLVWAGFAAAQSPPPQVVHVPPGPMWASAGKVKSEPVTILAAVVPGVDSIEYVQADPPHQPLRGIQVGRSVRVLVRFQKPPVQKIPLPIAASITGDSLVLTLEPTGDPAVYRSNRFRTVASKPR